MIYVNRRKAVKNIFVFSLLTSIGFGGLKFYSFRKKPPLASFSSYRNLIMELADTIIPATDTPGAKAANVQDFILNVVVNCSTYKDQNSFIIGLQDLEHYCFKTYNLSFCKCNLKEKIDVLNYFEQKENFSINFLNKLNKRIFGQPFISKLKSLTVQGYCMSFYGATQALAYDFIPEQYLACVPLQPNQKSWATK